MNQEKEYCVYKHTTPNGKVYIGQTCQSPELRWQNGNGYKGQVFYKAIQKYGWNNIEHEILKTNLTKDEANNLEKMYIALYQSNHRDFGYNQTEGGDGQSGFSPTIETREKISSTLMGHTVSEETRRKLSEAQKGKPKNYTEEYLQRLRDERLGKPLSEKQLAAISKPVLCVETGVIYKSGREACRITGIDYNAINQVCNHKYGFRTAGGYNWCFADDYNVEEYVANVVSSKPKKVICIETKEVYASLLDAQKNTRINASNISNCCKGKYGFKTAGGYHWCFYDEYDPNTTFKMSEKIKSVICIETDKVYGSIKSVSNDGFNPKGVSECCCGRQQTHKGYHWMYYDDYLKAN